jgi:hypothetical protein
LRAHPRELSHFHFLDASWRGDGGVFFITGRELIGIIRGSVIDHDFDIIAEIDIAGIGLGATGSALGKAVAWEPRF